MMHFETLTVLHKQHSEKSIPDIVAHVKSNTAKVRDVFHGFSRIPNRAFVKFRCIVQDNGYSLQIAPYSVPVIHRESGQQDDFNFLFMDYPGENWDLYDQLDPKNVASFIEKQPHCCILLPPADADIMLDRLELESQLPLHFSDPHFKQLFNKKLPNIPYDFACNIKTFMHQKPLLLNQVIEIVGILEKPVVAGPIEDFGLIEMLPVIHCIHHEPIDLFALCPEVEESPETVLSMATMVREETIKVLASALFGDRLAAEYVYISLFSKISKRIGGIPTGKFSVNLFNKDFTRSTARNLLEIVRKSKPITAILPITIESLNKNVYFQPSQNRFDQDQIDLGLCRGELQAPDGALFLLDETEMSTGTLDERGLSNANAIQQVLDFSTVNYELKFESMESKCDFNFLVMGKVKSLFATDFSVLVQNTEECTPLELKDKTGSLVQRLSSMAREDTFTISEDMEEKIHYDFVLSQKLARENGTTPDDGTLLLKRLVLAENYAKSCGLKELDVASWVAAGELEKSRLERFSSYKA